MSDLLRVEQLRVTLGSRTRPVLAVDDVDLTVGGGEVVALVGESGSGKTTLLRTIVGLEQPAVGRIVLGGQPVSDRAGLMRLRREVQLIFQDPAGALNPRRTVGAAVEEGLAIHGIGDRPQRVRAALAEAGLRPADAFVDRYPHQLSGGQRQRALIAGALALEPRLLLADEPVASLDASIRGEILALLRRLVDERGLGVLVVTHDLGLAWNVADRVAVMYLGRIVELGHAVGVLTEPQHPYTTALRSVAGLAPGAVPQLLHGEVPSASAMPSGCRFHPRCPLLQSGGAQQLGVAALCTAVDPVLVPVGDSLVACHATSADHRPDVIHETR
jgi:peptide/nickel transport system ATP-binding protein